MNGDENVTHQAETMLKQPKPFTGTCYRCGEVGHRVCDCRKSADLPEHSTNKTRKTIPQVVDVNVDRTALLGRELAERASGVDEGDRTEHEPPMQLQQTKLYCEENCQCNGNANKNIPNTYGLPLKGEWIVCVSSEPRGSKGSANMSNTSPDHADGSSKSKVTENTAGVKSEGCENGTVGERACDDEVDCNPGRTKPTDTPDELTEFVVMSEDPDSSDVPHICLQAAC